MKVLHVKDSTVSVEEVYKVTRFHVMVLNPTFSDIGVALRKRFRRRVHCDLRIYRSTKVILTLHTYLIPCDHQLGEVRPRSRQKAFVVLTWQHGADASPDMLHRAWTEKRSLMDFQDFRSQNQRGRVVWGATYTSRPHVCPV